MDDSEKFACKFCNKKFRCGKSLGGHIRIHLKGSLSTRSNYFEEEARLKTLNGGQSGYELRENPKKTARFSLNVSDSSLVRVCGKCGKGFQSMKALCGHMASHPKSINSLEDLSHGEKLEEIGIDSQWHANGNKRIRCATIGGELSSLPTAYGSCSASDIEQEEQEEVAMCLMMLSHDSGFRWCSSSVLDSSDNNSVVLEAKSSRSKIKIRTRNGVDDCSEKKKAKRKDHSPSFDSGDFSSESTGIELKIPHQGFAKKQKLELDSEFDKEFDTEFRKRLSRFRWIKTKYAFDPNHTDSTKRHSTKSNEHRISSSNEGEKFKFFNENSVNNWNLKTQTSRGRRSIALNSVGRKGIIHKCPFCSKVFKSGQALGGHKRSHFIGGIDDDDRSVLIKQEESALIDLNFPATVEEETSGL